MARYPGVRKHGTTWYVYWRRNGRWHEERTEARSAREAAETRVDLLKRLERGELLPRAERLADPNLKELIELSVGPKSSQFEKDMAAAVLKRFGSDAPLRILSPAVVELWAQDLRNTGRSTSTIRKYLLALGRYFRRARKSARGRALLGDLRNPIEDVDIPAEPEGRRRALTADQETALWQAAQAAPEHYRRWIALCLFAGLRVHEARRLRWDDVDLEAGVFHVREGKTGARIVAMGPRLTELLRGWRRFGSEYVLGTYVDRPSRRLVQRLFAAAGVPAGSLRWLRTTHDQAALRAGVPIELLADQSGHDPATIWEWYGRATAEQRAQVAASVEATIPETVGKSFPPFPPKRSSKITNTPKTTVQAVEGDVIN